MGISRYEYRVSSGSTRSCAYYRLDDALRFARSLGAKLDHRTFQDRVVGGHEVRVWSSTGTTECVVTRTVRS